MSAFRICQGLWIAWIVIWLVWALQSKRTKLRESIGSRISYAIPAWAAMFFMFDARSLGPWGRGAILPAGTVLAETGIAITALGFVVTLWARYILGANWSGIVTVKVDHELIRTGPYRWVRHPIYTGLMVSMIGTAAALDEWRSVPAVLLLWIAFTIKRLKEEQFMRQTFGDRYIEYSHATGAIFPRL